MQVVEVFACEVNETITELVVTSGDEDALLEIKGSTYGKIGVAYLTVSWEVWSIYAVLYKEGVAPLLSPQLFPIHHGQKHSNPGPCLGSPSLPTDIQHGG